MSKRTPNELLSWCHIKGQIGQQLKDHYRACTTEELPPRLRALIKELEEKPELSAEQVQAICERLED
jgi:hypothetical protein